MKSKFKDQKQFALRVKSITLKRTGASLIGYLIGMSTLYLGIYLGFITAPYSQAHKITAYSVLSVLFFLGFIYQKQDWTPSQSELIGRIQMVNSLIIIFYWSLLVHEVRVIVLFIAIFPIVFLFSIGNIIISLLVLITIIGSYFSVAYYSIHYIGTATDYKADILISIVFCCTSLFLIAIAQGHKKQRKQLKQSKVASEKNSIVLEETKNKLTKTFEDIKKMISDVAALTNKVNEESVSIAKSNSILSEGAAKQAESIQQVSENIKHIREQTSANSENASKVSELVMNAQSLSNQSVLQMNEMNTAIDAINESCKSISKIITTIDDISFQTNLLALNAAIEASKAGKYGKGFAVVAQEVRKLASESAKAASKIEVLIKNLISKVEKSTQLSTVSVEALSDINNKISEVSYLVESIVLAGIEQNKGVLSVNKSMERISVITQENASNIELTNLSASKLSTTSKAIQSNIDNYTNSKQQQITYSGEKETDKEARLKRLRKLTLTNNAMAFLLFPAPIFVTYMLRFFGLIDCDYTRLNYLTSYIAITLSIFVLVVYFKKTITPKFSQFILYPHLINGIIICWFWLTMLGDYRFIILFTSITAFIFLFSYGNFVSSLVFISVCIFSYLGVSYYLIEYLGYAGNIKKEAFYCYTYFYSVAYLLGMSQTFQKQRTQMKRAKKESDRIQAILQKRNEELKVIYTNISKPVNEIALLSKQIVQDASTISANSKMLSDGAAVQEEATGNVTDAIFQINKKTGDNKEITVKVENIVEIAKNSSAKGLGQMEKMNIAIESIMESGKAISKIIHTIDSLAFQTNLLALNAAVEAARANKHGKGFANVAHKIRDLASKSAEAANTTSELIEDSINKVEIGNSLSKSSVLSIKEIDSKMSEINDLIKVIVDSSILQEKAVSETNTTMISISEITKRNSTHTRQTHDAAGKLSAMAQKVRQLLYTFNYTP